MNNDQDHSGPNGPYGYPPLLVLKRWVTLRDRIGIVENQNSGFKANVVLPKVLAILVFVPLKSHGLPFQYNVETFVLSIH